MPKFNGTGPQGMGPKTGRGLGQCSLNQKQSLLNRRQELEKQLEAIKKEEAKLAQKK